MLSKMTHHTLPQERRLLHHPQLKHPAIVIELPKIRKGIVSKFVTDLSSQ